MVLGMAVDIVRLLVVCSNRFVEEGRYGMEVVERGNMVMNGRWPSALTRCHPIPLAHVISIFSISIPVEREW